MTNVLVIAPHADDEALGCGGMIARYARKSASHRIAVAVLSDKWDGRMDEFEAARAILGYSVMYGPQFRTGTLADNERALVGYLDGIVREFRPHELYLPTPGAHQDHIAAYECGVRSARLSYTNGVWFVPNVYLYEVPSYATDLYPTPYPWSRYVPFHANDMEQKASAIRAYVSQNTGGFDPSVLAAKHAAYIGSQVNMEYAERFAVVRAVDL